MRIGAANSDAFFSFFGDGDGDGDGDRDRDVDGQDYGRLAKTFMKSEGDAGFDAAFDIDGDGDVDGQDLGRFEQSFMKRLEFQWGSVSEVDTVRHSLTY